MSFLQVKKGLYVNTSKIEAVEAVSDLTCKLYTSKKAYEADFPCEAILKLIGKSVDKDAVMKKLDGVLSTQGFFSG